MADLRAQDIITSVNTESVQSTPCQMYVSCLPAVSQSDKHDLICQLKPDVDVNSQNIRVQDATRRIALLPVSDLLYACFLVV
jgi:hypothetical protein